MEEFGFPRKLINITKVWLKGSKAQVECRNTVSDSFGIDNGVIQEDDIGKEIEHRIQSGKGWLQLLVHFCSQRPCLRMVN